MKGTAADGDSRASNHTHETLDTSESASASDSIGGGSDSSGRRRMLDTHKRGIFKSKLEHVIVTMSPTLALVQYDCYARPNPADVGSVLQVFAAFVLVGIPASYMQMVLGQYAHIGVFLLKRMVPIADGVGFSYCLTTFFISLLVALQVQMMLLYTLLTFVPGPLQWSQCADSPGCWEVWRTCDAPGGAPCIGAGVHVAAHVYWNVTLMSGAADIDLRGLQSPRVVALFTSFVTWVLIYLLAQVRLQRLKVLVRHVSVGHLLIKAAIAVLLTLRVGPVVAFTTVTIQAIGNILNVAAWREAIVRAVVALVLGDFSHLMMGALASDSARTGTVAFLAGLLSFTALLIDDVMINVASIALCERTRLPFNQRPLLFHPPHSPKHLTLIPTTFELLAWPRFWILIVYLNKIFAMLFRIILNTHFLLEAISHRFPMLSSYKKYASPSYCVFAWCISIIFQGHRAYAIRTNFHDVTVYFCQYFNVLMFATMVSYVYGVRRFCDDVHFLRDLAPNLYWRITWMLLPLLLALTLSVDYLSASSPFFNERIIEIVVTFSPYLVLTTIEVMKKIVQRSTITLITPEAKWGPKEPERRRQRQLFNPRYATRYTRDSFQCRHLCLNNNKRLKEIVLREEQLMVRLTGPRGQHRIVHHPTGKTGLRSTIAAFDEGSLQNRLSHESND